MNWRKWANLSASWIYELSAGQRALFVVLFASCSWFFTFLTLEALSRSLPLTQYTLIVGLSVANLLFFWLLFLWLLSQADPVDHHLDPTLHDKVFWVLVLLGLVPVYAIPHFVSMDPKRNLFLITWLYMYLAAFIRLPPKAAITMIPIMIIGYDYNAFHDINWTLTSLKTIIGITIWAYVNGNMAEMRDEHELRLKNQQLKTAQESIVAVTAQNERLRISREIYDQMGQQLRKLDIQLEQCALIANPELSESIEKARSASKRLYASVQRTIQSPTAASPTSPNADEFKTQLLATVAAVEGLDIHLDFDSKVNLATFQFADALMMAIKECITNSLKHSNATMMRIRVAQRGNALVIKTQDNGTLSPKQDIGCGLLGITERLEALGGYMHSQYHKGLGFCVEMTAPLSANKSHKLLIVPKI